MSIIHDALKKTQDQMTTEPILPKDAPMVEPILTTPKATAETPVKKTSPKNWITLGILTAIALLIAFVIVSPYKNIFINMYQQYSSLLFHKNTPPALPASTTPAPAIIKENQPINQPVAVVQQQTENTTAQPTAQSPAPTAVPALEPEQPVHETPPIQNIEPNTEPNKPQIIQGIMANGNNNIALINDRVYEDGTVINGIKIIKIDLKSITVLKNGQEETLVIGDQIK